MGKQTLDKSSIAVYPGTFDPITMGHVDIIERSLNLFSKVIVAVAVNASKTPVFSLDERIQMIEDTFKDYSRIEVHAISGLLVEFAYQQRGTIVRGLRAVSDFEYEFQLALMNRKLNREVDSLFLMPSFRWIFISSSIIKDAARNGGDVSDMVPFHVNEMLIKKFPAANPPLQPVVPS